ncbi:hypothetical protein CY34DRAFT_806805 [Suillus luteus UH-Slu-Lm8-n1]|uniref:Uncharacterized protein n=1 Tax=Suillus luteus UH-Slu-Lm8-n1 TaxID=930992 RepID=A0A0D0B2V0_9AGAM|nr:hypothetical protein CY34DRAFT_806805 [Suillus luteus UH-Slu-Lm8-n1]
MAARALDIHVCTAVDIMISLTPHGKLAAARTMHAVVLTFTRATYATSRSFWGFRVRISSGARSRMLSVYHPCH